MREEIAGWLARLPIAEERASDGVPLTGILSPGAPGEVCIVVSDVCLVFLREDILTIDDAAGFATAPEQPQSVSIEVRQGAPLVKAFASGLLGEARAGRRPFALSCRPPVVTHEPMPRFRELEHQFLRRHGLLAE